MVDICGRPHIPVHICHCPLQWPDDTLADHCLWVVVLDALNLIVPLLKRHLSLPRSGSPLKVLILGVPILSPPTSMLRRQLTSTSAQGGLADCWTGSPGPHSLPLGRSLPCCPGWLSCHPQGSSDYHIVTHVGLQFPPSWLPLTGQPPACPIVRHHQSPRGP